jgi:hypothetical protein
MTEGNYLKSLVRGAGFEPARGENDGDGEESEVFDIWKLKKIGD